MFVPYLDHAKFLKDKAYKNNLKRNIWHFYLKGTLKNGKILILSRFNARVSDNYGPTTKHHVSISMFDRFLKRGEGGGHPDFL